MATPFYYYETNIDLANGHLLRTMHNFLLSEGDRAANKFVARVFNKKVPYDLTGCSVIGYFIRSNETTVLVPGTASGNQVTVSLPESCYAVPGNFTMALKVYGTGYTDTLWIIDGTVSDTYVGSIVDPGNVIPDISTLESMIQEAEAAIAAISNITIATESIGNNSYKILISKTATTE